ncbi:MULTISPECIES: hypothetical protein [Cysteiniphilum]|uniref:Uncharacterized protein n=1 Tax=Cysteiniphilum litorale TaxID=2056700 RepID=A0A8J2Z6S8_9GAMM|nr:MULTISPECIES: hypothetical protein [Cysteiniphilum]GGG08192.1 hypothetical protein GCM10010995_27180 [Cysteiniphilum litorale]
MDNKEAIVRDELETNKTNKTNQKIKKTETTKINKTAEAEFKAGQRLFEHWFLSDYLQAERSIKDVD